MIRDLWDFIEWLLIIASILLISVAIGYVLATLFALIISFPVAVFAATLCVGTFWFVGFAWVHSEICKL